jgi:hypothetical protein
MATKTKRPARRPWQPFKNGRVRLTRQQWADAARERFKRWEDFRFICPACGHEQTIDQMRRSRKMPSYDWGKCCIGRWLGECAEAFSDEPGPCNYRGDGLYQMNPIAVVTAEGHVSYYFDFAVRPLSLKIETVDLLFEVD